MSQGLVLDFSRISIEFRNLVSRRRELVIFLGSLFAAMGIMLQNILEGKLPRGLATLKGSAFLAYALLLLVPTVVIALRIARLHGGLVVNGIFYARTLAASIRPNLDPRAAARLNWSGVSTQMFLLAAVISGFASGLLALALAARPWLAALTGLAAFAVLVVVHLRYHAGAVRFALAAIQTATVEPLDAEEWENHLSGSLQDANHDMLALISFVGLMLFSVLQSVSGLGAATPGTDLALEDVQRNGPLFYALLLLVTSAMACVVYVRLLLAMASLSVQLDPTDRPYRPLKITDSFLGYSLIAFFLAVAVHLTGHVVRERPGAWLWVADLAALLGALAAYHVALAVAGRRAAPVSSGK